MKLKYFKMLCVPLIFLLSALFHFWYDWFPSFFTSLISGVNESIWEHNKIIFFPFLLIAIGEKIYYKDQKNVIFSEFISMMVCTLLVLFIFSPVYFYVLGFKDNMIVTFAILIFAIIVSQFVSYKLLNKPFNKKLEIFGGVSWICIFLLYAILTYYPLPYDIFYDFSNNKYGI